jgi:pyruvate dehydrogenase E2 component (dihydrolipoamide acetyltransferase)
MAEVIRMPKMSDTMEEGVIAKWLKKVGDEVKAGDILAEVETDKATMELEAYEDGTLLHIGIKDGEAAPVNGIIAVIGKKGESFDDLLKDEGGNASSNGKDDKKLGMDGKETSKKNEEERDTSDIKASVITMPKMSDTMTEGTIANWLKKVGDTVKSGDIIAEVETDKATMELEAYEDGTLLYIGVKAGESVEVDGVIAVIGEKGADYQSLIKAHKQKATTSVSATVKTQAPPFAESAPVEQIQETNSEKQGLTNGRILASPLARKMAKDKGYDINLIIGTGDNGRVTKKDVEAYIPGKSKPAVQQVVIPEVIGEERYEEVTISQMRKTIAKRLSDSKYTSPHFYLTMEINMEKCISARNALNEISPVKISFNDIIIKASASALRQHPKVNSSWLGDKIRYNKHIHIGVAVAVDEGLLVPVVRFADGKTLSQISAEVKDLGVKAKSKQLQPKDWEGNTFTISNLGMFGIEEFTAIINPPDACILAVGGIKETPVVKNGEVVPGNVMKVTLSCDHRVVDGAIGSAFLQTLKQMLEEPVRILV